MSVRIRKKILIIGALPTSLVNFRGSLIKAMLSNGIKVYTTANGPDPDTKAKLQSLGAEYYPVCISRAGINPLADIFTFLDFIRLIKRVKPDLVVSYTIKPIIYGGLAARVCGVRNVFSLVEGLGRAFMPWESFSHFISSVLAKGLYRISLLCSKRVFFSNPDDLSQFVKGRYISERKVVLHNGTGIDLMYYSQEKLPESSCIRFLMIARLLKDKGVREFIEATKIVLTSYRNIEFILAGDLDDNPSSIKQEELDLWRREGIVKYVGQVDDVRPLYRDCHIYVLPSYREGMPRTVLEALASGRAIITTDVPGCRETVRNLGSGCVWKTEEGARDIKIGSNGILVPAKDINALAEAMAFFIKNPNQIVIMGGESRRYAEERYDVHNVNIVLLREMGLIK